MCYGEGRGKGRWVARYSFEKLSVARWYLSASGDRFDFQVAVPGRHTPPPPSREGRLGCGFLLESVEFEWGGFPSREGSLGTYFFLKVSKLYKGCCFLSPVQEKYLVYVFF